MNKQQLYTFGGALLASTALSGAANALTWGKVTGSTLTFTTTAASIANTLFSTTASTANSVVISANGANRIAARFANNYNASNVAGTQFSIEMSPTGATLSSASTANAKFLIVGSHGSTFQATIAASTLCNNAVGFGTQFVLNGCTAAATTAGSNRSLTVGGVMFSGITFTNASGLATAGNAIQMTGRVYNTSTSGNFEANATSNVITSVAPIVATVNTRANVTASAVTTPLAFTSLATSNVTGNTSATLTMELVQLSLTSASTATNVIYRNDLNTVATPNTEHSSIRVTVTSALLSSGAVAAVTLVGGTPAANLTAANFSGGTVTFDVSQSGNNSFTVQVVFNGTTAIPSASAGTATFVFATENGNGQAIPSVSGATAATNQGGFRAEVNTFNSSANGPYSSYLRIHNNGAVAGTVTLTVRNDDHASGALLGSSFTTAAIQPNGTMQLSAAEIEGTATSTKLPAGGANIPAASRVGSYTISATGPIVGYVQHILFDGTNVADLSSFRNSGQTSNNAAP